MRNVIQEVEGWKMARTAVVEFGLFRKLLSPECPMTSFVLRIFGSFLLTGNGSDGDAEELERRRITTTMFAG